jgi:hypothetical protein
MLVKLVFVILVVGTTASALLVNRQQRIETFHEMSVIHQRLLDQRSTLWKLQSQIAARSRPSEVREAVDHLSGAWAPIPASPMRSQADLQTASPRLINPEPDAKPAKTKTNAPRTSSSNTVASRPGSSPKPIDKSTIKPTAKSVSTRTSAR